MPTLGNALKKDGTSPSVVSMSLYVASAESSARTGALSVTAIVKAAAVSVRFAKSFGMGTSIVTRLGDDRRRCMGGVLGARPVRRFARTAQ
jgi:hypothetical protein